MNKIRSRAGTYVALHGWRAWLRHPCRMWQQRRDEKELIGQTMILDGQEVTITKYSATSGLATLDRPHDDGPEAA